MKLPISKTDLDRHRYAAGFCLLVILVPYWSFLFAPGRAGVGARLFTTSLLAILDALLLAGVLFCVRRVPGKGAGSAKLALTLAAAMAYFFVVGFRNAAAGAIFLSAEFPDFFLALPPGEGVAAFMFLGLAFTAFEFWTVSRIGAGDQ